jgi:hypothetical protein
MFDYEGARMYAEHRCRQLLAEAEQYRLLDKPRSPNVALVVLPRLVGWTGDLLITTGLRLKAMYQPDNAPHIQTLLQSTSHVQTE